MSNMQNATSELEIVIDSIEHLIETLSRVTLEDAHNPTERRRRHRLRVDESSSPFDDPPSDFEGLTRDLEIQRISLRLERVIEDLEVEITAWETFNEKLRNMLSRLRLIGSDLD